MYSFLEPFSAVTVNVIVLSPTFKDLFPVPDKVAFESDNVAVTFIDDLLLATLAIVYSNVFEVKPLILTPSIFISVKLLSVEGAVLVIFNV